MRSAIRRERRSGGPRGVSGPDGCVPIRRQRSGRSERGTRQPAGKAIRRRLGPRSGWLGPHSHIYGNGLEGAAGRAGDEALGRWATCWSRSAPMLVATSVWVDATAWPQSSAGAAVRKRATGCPWDCGGGKAMRARGLVSLASAPWSPSVDLCGRVVLSTGPGRLVSSCPLWEAVRSGRCGNFFPDRLSVRGEGGNLRVSAQTKRGTK